MKEKLDRLFKKNISLHRHEGGMLPKLQAFGSITFDKMTFGKKTTGKCNVWQNVICPNVMFGIVSFGQM